MPYIKHMFYGSTEKHMPLPASTRKSICASGARMGRKMRYPEKREAAFAEGTLARIQAALTDGENQVGFIRDAVDRELKRRGA